ncbi:MAG: DUF1365 domain-containing protein [Planctomycetes bacterium]|nr:DUF1365 domain-containing protein [Planctomycetota bacterium]
MRSALYRGTLTHARWRPVHHRFRYPVYLWLVDLDELPEIHKRLRLFSYNRWNIVSLHDRDYQQTSGGSLAESVRRFCVESGAPRPARILALTHARVFGYAFNPVTFFYALDEQDRVQSIVAEVNNTFGDTHRYLLDGRRRTSSAHVYEHEKLMHVSPFFSLLGRYRFDFSQLPQAEDGSPLEVAMDYEDEGHPAFHAQLSLRRSPLTDRTLAACLVRFPLMTVQVIALIHWEALKLWWKKAPFHSCPPYDPQAAQLLHERESALRHRSDSDGTPVEPPVAAKPRAERASPVAARPPHAAVS